MQVQMDGAQAVSELINFFQAAKGNAGKTLPEEPLKVVKQWYLKRGVEEGPGPSILPWGFKYETLRVEELQRAVTQASESKSFTKSDLSQCKKLLRVIRITQLAHALRRSQDHSKKLVLLFEIEEAFLSASFISQSQGSIEKREILKALHGLLPVVRFIRSQEDSKKLVSDPTKKHLLVRLALLCEILRALAAPDELLWHSGYHAIAFLFFVKENLPSYESYREFASHVTSFFSSYAALLGSRNSYMILCDYNEMGCGTWRLRLQGRDEGLYYSSQGWHTDSFKTKKSSLVELLTLAYPGYFPAPAPMNLSDLHHPLEHLPSPQATGRFFWGYFSKLPRPPEGMGLVNYCVHREIRPYFLVIARENDEIEPHLCALDSVTLLYQWQGESAHYPPCTSIQELMQQLYPKPKYQPRCIAPDMGSPAIFSHERIRHRAKDWSIEFKSLIDAVEQRASAETICAEVERLLLGPFSQSYLFRCELFPEYQGTVENSIPLARSLAKCLSQYSLSQDQRRNVAFLYYLCCSARMPRKVFAHDAYHGNAFLYHLREKKPELFDSSLEWPLLDGDYLRDCLSASDYGSFFLLPAFNIEQEFVSLIWRDNQEIRITRLNYSKYASKPWQAEGEEAIYYHLHELLKARHHLTSIVPSYPIRIPFDAAAPICLPEFHGTVLGRGRSYFGRFLAAPFSYCLIASQVHLTFFIVVRDEERLKKHLVQYNPTHLRYILVNKKKSGTLSALLAELYPGKTLTAIPAPQPRELNFLRTKASLPDKVKLLSLADDTANEGL